MRKNRLTVTPLLLLVLMAGAVLFPAEVSAACADSIMRCVKVIIPSLFMFMAVSKLLIATGASDMLSKPLDKLFSKVLGIPYGGASVFIISNAAGYPVGAGMLSELVSNGRMSRASAEAMSVYCYAAGPAFILNIIGSGVFSDSRVGIVIFLSIIFTNLLLAAIIGRISKPGITSSHPPKINFAEALTDSVASAGDSLLKMCFMIVFFSAITAVADCFGLFSLVENTFGMSGNAMILFRSAFEITNLCSLSSNAAGLIPFVTVICGFGGICVVLQTAAVIHSGYSIKKFLLYLPVRAIMNYAFAKLFCRLMLEDSIPVFVKSEKIIVELDNLLPSICLIMMIFILVLQKRLDFFHKV